MKKQALTAIEIEALALSISAALDEWRRPVSEDSAAYASKPQTPRRAALHRLIDSFALAACSMAGVYGGVWLDPPDDAAQPPRFGALDWEKERHD